MFHQSFLAQLNDFDSKSGFLKNFKQKGFLTLPSFVCPTSLSIFIKEIDDLCTSLEQENTCHRGVKSATGEVIVMNRLDVQSDCLFDFARHSHLVNFAEYLVEKPVVPLHVEYFCKPAHSLDKTPPHQDQVFYYDHFDSELAISFWIALDDINEDSAPLEYVPSSEKKMLPHVLSTSIGFDKEIDPSFLSKLGKFQKAPINKGGCIVHNSYIVHKANENKSEHARRAIVFNYRGSPWKQYWQARM